MQLLNVIWEFLNSHTTEVLAVLLGSGLLSVVLETVLHKLKIDSKKLAHALLQLFSIVTSVVTFYLASLSPENATGLYAALFIVASVYHRFIVSPFYTKTLVPFLQFKADQKAQAPGKIQSESSPAVESQDNFVS